MGLSLGGNANLAAFAAKLRALPREARREVLKAIADELEALALLGFVDARAPDGKAWAPLKYREGDPLRRTSGAGGLMASVTGKPTATGARLGTPKVYGVHHQFGAPRANVPQRQFLPLQDEPLPDAWAGSVEEAADEALAEVLARLGL